jgi:hypothetical protein
MCYNPLLTIVRKACDVNGFGLRKLADDMIHQWEDWRGLPRWVPFFHTLVADQAWDSVEEVAEGEYQIGLTPGDRKVFPELKGCYAVVISVDEGGTPFAARVLRGEPAELVYV